MPANKVCVHHWNVTIENGQEVGHCIKCPAVKVFRDFHQTERKTRFGPSKPTNIHSFAPGAGPTGQFSGYTPIKSIYDIPPSWHDSIKIIEE